MTPAGGEFSTRLQASLTSAAMGFLAPVETSVGQNPVGVAVGDFNHDGNPDLVVADSGGKEVSVLLGDGMGGFSNANHFATGIGPKALAIGDFNGDGNLDIVTVNQNDYSVLLGNGDGTFQKPLIFTLPKVIAGQVSQTATGVAVGDFNRDGKLDLVVTAFASLFDASKGYVDVLLGNGDGTFTVASTTPINSDNPSSVAVADFNGDGNLDVVAGNNSRGTQVSLLSGGGDGNVQETAEPNLGISFPASIVVADFNNDGIPDLAAAGVSFASGSIQGAVGFALGNGDGTFQAPQILTSTGFPGALAVGDFNRDGNLDIVTANGGSVNVFLGNGKGAFQAALSFTGVSFPKGIAVGDFNHDGFPDLAETAFFAKSVAVLINSGNWPPVSIASTAPALTTPASPAAGTALPTTLINNLTMMSSQAPMPSGVMMTAKESAVLDQLFTSGDWWSDLTDQDVDPLSPAKLWEPL
jgi:hypothetical protein